MAIDLGAGDVAQAREVAPIMDKYVDANRRFPENHSFLEDTLTGKDFGAPFVDVIGQVMPLSVDGMIL